MSKLKRKAGLSQALVNNYALGMTAPKVKRRGNSLVMFVLAFACWIVGGTMILWPNPATYPVLIGAFLVVAGVVFMVLALVYYSRDVKDVARVTMGAAVKINRANLDRPSSSVELARLADLHANGSLTDAEFAAAKAKILE